MGARGARGRGCPGGGCAAPRGAAGPPNSGELLAREGLLRCEPRRPPRTPRPSHVSSGRARERSITDRQQPEARAAPARGALESRGGFARTPQDAATQVADQIQGVEKPSRAPCTLGWRSDGSNWLVSQDYLLCDSGGERQTLPGRCPRRHLGIGFPLGRVARNRPPRLSSGAQSGLRGSVDGRTTHTAQRSGSRAEGRPDSVWL